MKTVLFSLGLTLFSISIQAQNVWTSRDSSLVAKLEKSLTLAEAKLKKAEVKVAYADSLIEIGSSQLNEGKSLKKQLSSETKSLKKEYSVSRKPYVKISKSKNRDEASEAKAELKKIDSQYKIDAKELSNKVKVNDKLISTGTRNLSKGKTYSKTYGKSLKDAQDAYDYAGDNLKYTLEYLNEDPQDNKKGKNKR